MRGKILVALLLVAILLFSFGCTKSTRDKAKQKCVQLCLEEKVQGMNLSNGPCLSNNIEPGWVCDVAHYPREPIDNNPKYQCPAYGKTAHHFVEVTPNCTFIRAI